MNRKTYFLSGLGADKRVFSKLNLPPQLNIIHIEWITPLKDEGLTEYANRLLLQINTSEPFQLVGLSFGGIVASEISKIVKPEKIIILSSVSIRGQLPWYFRFAGILKLYKFIPSILLKYPGPFFYWFFGAESDEDRGLLRRILEDSDPILLKWAIGKIATWDNTFKADNLHHIHGTKDRIFPYRYVDADESVINGGHLMVYNIPEAISKKLSPALLAE